MSFEDIKDRDDAIAFWNDVQQREIDDLSSELSDAIGEFGMELFVTTRLCGKLNSMNTIAKLFGDDKFQLWIGKVRGELCRRIAEADIAEKYKP